MDNSAVVSQWKENFRLSQPATPRRFFFFGGILFLVVDFLTIPS